MEKEPQYYEKNRRSVDWRDSGIVIDDFEDHQFNSVDTISCELPSKNPEKFAYNHDDDGDTILHLAVVGFTVEKVKDLIRICDRSLLDSINNMMQTPMHVATMANRPEIVSLLIESGANMGIHDRKGNTPLHLACQKGFPEIVQIILDSRIGTFPNNKDNILEITNFDGQTCLHLAASSNNLEIIKLLVNKYFINPNYHESRSGATILHYAVNKLNLELISYIVSIEKHCNEADYYNRRPLDTVHILKDSICDRDQIEKLSVAEKLITERIKLCIEQNGCCSQYDRPFNQILETSSSSSSEFSDSDPDAS